MKSSLFSWIWGCRFVCIYRLLIQRVFQQWD